MAATAVSAIPAEDIPKYKGLLKDVKETVDELRRWKEKAEGATPEFEGELKKALGFFSAAFNIFRDDQQFNSLADELAADIVDMRNHLGEKFMPLPKFYGFSRGMVDVGPQVLVAIQYYEEIPFYGPPRKCEENKALEITKFCEWKVARGSKDDFGPGTPIECTYYLEKSVLERPHYVLGMSAPGMHASIHPFNEQKPGFFTLEDMIVNHLKQRREEGKFEYVAASYKH